ncbi:hypothetical protein RI367_002908 [Sorochytrium milnesiophthora]
MSSPNFSSSDTELLLTVVEQIEQLDNDQWERVCFRYNMAAVDNGYPERDYDSLRRMFRTLARHRISTGAPDIPQAVRRAREIQRDINANDDDDDEGRQDEPPNDPEAVQSDNDKSKAPANARSIIQDTDAGSFAANATVPVTIRSYSKRSGMQESGAVVERSIATLVQQQPENIIDLLRVEREKIELERQRAQRMEDDRRDVQNQYAQLEMELLRARYELQMLRAPR